MGLLLLTLVVFEATPLDLWIQDCFYDVATRRWWIDAHDPIPRWLFYVGPKVLLVLFGLGVITLLSGPQSWREGCGLGHRRRELATVLAVLALGPSLIGGLKSITGVFCPYEIVRYGGIRAYVGVFDRYPDPLPAEQRGRGFPAGHASGGFALFSLAGIAETRRGQRIAIGVGLLAGTCMGGYQMLKGAHFFSHTLVTALIIWLLFLFVFWILRKRTPLPSPAK